MIAEWGPLVPALKKAYRTSGAEDQIDQDFSYLETAFNRIEQLWLEAIIPAHIIKLVLLAEAPMFCETESYIYNPSAGATDFFTYVDAEELVGPISETSSLINGLRPRKKEMIFRLTKAGIIILDLFPFALKLNYTAVDYRTLSGKETYKELFRDTMHHYFLPKLCSIKSKFANPVKFAFRYAGVRNQLETVVIKAIKSQIGIDFKKIISVHDGRSMNRKQLKNLLIAGNHT